MGFLKKTLKKIAFRIQKIIAYVVYWLSSKNIEIKYVFGVDDIGGAISRTKELLGEGYSVCLSINSKFDFKYDYSFLSKNTLLSKINRLFWGPVLFGRLASKSNIFFYNWNTGFTLDRRFEFQFLKKRNKKIITRFCGDDIRSLKLSSEFASTIDYDISSNYYYEINPVFANKEYDSYKIKIAKDADDYSDLIFSFPIDQISYIKKETVPWFHYLPDYMFSNKEKFQNGNITKIRILHAPSSPIIKGTQLVRAAIKKLKVEGYSFEYVELIGVENQEVLKELDKSHIVLNQFYLFVPGVFGLEAMARKNAVLMSADPNIEKSLVFSDDEPWLITPYFNIYDNLKLLLDNPEKIKRLAESGYQYVQKYHSKEAVKNYLLTLINDL